MVQKAEQGTPFLFFVAIAAAPPGIVCVTCPNHPDKGHRLGYKAK